MRRNRTMRWSRRAAQSASLAATALIAAACATPDRSGPASLEVHEGGFTIREDVRVGLGVRSEFDGAVSALRSGAHAEGIARLLEVTESAPGLLAAHVNLGIAYRETNDLERAHASLERALELDPGHPVALNEMGIVQRRMGRFQESRHSYEQALDAFPDFHFARRNLAILCDLYLADHSCALEHYEQYVEAVPDDAEAAMWMADLRQRFRR